MSTPATERRERVYFVDESALLELFHAQVEEAYLCPKKAQVATIPRGAKIERTWIDPTRRAIGLLVSHRSFGVVPDGDIPPQMPEFVEVEWQVLRRVTIAGQTAYVWRPQAELFLEVKEPNDSEPRGTNLEDQSA
jgi:hypothetical protein